MQEEQQKSQHYDVIIIGAGLAGLSAARYITKNSNMSVLILEAQEKCGGRLNSLVTPSNCVIELGASYMHGIDNHPLMRFGKELFNEMEASSQDLEISGNNESNQYKFLFTPLRSPPYRGYYDAKTGDEISYYEENDFNKLFSLIRNKMYHYSNQMYFNNDAHEKDMSIQQFVEMCLNPKNNGQNDQDLARIQTFHKKLLQAHGEEKCKRYILDSLMGLAGYYAMDIHNCSIAGCMDPQEAHLQGGNHLIKEGHELIAKRLAKNLNIKYNTLVQKVNWQTKNHVKIEAVETTIAASQQQLESQDQEKAQESKTTLVEYTSKHVIVTVSVGVLKSKLISFEPSLPCQAAVDKFTMGTLDKVAIEFDTKFWDPQDFFISFLPDDASHDRHFEFYMNLDFIYKGSNTLLGFVHGKYAQDLEEMSDDQVATEFLKPFLPMIKKSSSGGEVPKVVKLYKSKWFSNPLFRGSYSAVPIGNFADLYDEMSNDVNSNDTLYMAGEATWREYPGTTTGALLSGELAAKRILKVFQ